MTRSKAPGRLWPVGQGPLYVTHGQGAYLTADDGREYLDMLCALGAISLGYGMWGSSWRVYSLPHLAEVEAAEAVLRDVAPWASHVRFTKTGSESTHAAYRIAKRATGRRYVLMGDWAYSDEWLLSELSRQKEAFKLRVQYFPSLVELLRPDFASCNQFQKGWARDAEVIAGHAGVEHLSQGADF